jgi:hypothetical protein
MTAETEAETLNFIVQLKNDETRLQYALLEPVGMVTLLAGSFDGTHVLSSGPLAKAIPPALPLAAIQLIHWPKRSVSAGFSGAIEISEDSGSRKLNRRGHPLFTVTWGEAMVVRVTEPPLTLRIGKAQGE